MTHAVLYAAKSTQDVHLSIPDQLSDAREMADESGWTVVGQYKDEGFSAYSGNRGPDWVRAQEHAARVAAEDGAPVMLVAQAHDRFARGAGDRPGAPESLVEVWTRLRRLDVHLRTVEDDQEFRDAQSVAAIGQRAHMDSMRKGRSVKKGMKRRRDQGLHTGGPVYGYDRVDKHLVPHPEQAAVVQRIFRMVADGTPQAEVCRILNAEITETGSPRPYGGGDWLQGSLSVMLRRRTYLGEIPDDDWKTRKNRNVVERWRPGAHDGIVEEELFDLANASNAKRVKRGGGGGRTPKAGHLLTGKMLHHDCGSAMVPRSSQRKDGAVTGSYTCSGKKTGRCEGLVLPMTEVDNAVLAYLADVGVDAEGSVKRAQEATEAAQTATASARQAAAKEVAAASSAIAKMENDYQRGALAAEDYTRFKVAQESARDEAQAQLAALTTTATPEDVVPVVVNALAVVRQAIAEKNADGVREVLRTLFADFIIGDLSGEEGLTGTVGDAPTPRLAATLRSLVSHQDAIEASNAEALAEQARLEDALDAAEAPPVEPVPGVTILPIPHAAALAGADTGSYIVDENGRDLFRRLPVPITYVQGLTT